MDTQKMEADRGVLAESVVFKGIAPASIEVILKQGLVLEAKAGDLVFYENMRGGMGLYVLLEGELEVFRGSADADGATPDASERLSVLKPGQCFGEYSLIDGLNTSASARALTSARLFFLARGQFELMVERDALVAKTLYRNLLVYLIGRLRQR